MRLVAHRQMRDHQGLLLHAFAEEGVPIRQVAEVIGRQPGLQRTTRELLGGSPPIAGSSTISTKATSSTTHPHDDVGPPASRCPEPFRCAPTESS